VFSEDQEECGICFSDAKQKVQLPKCKRHKVCVDCFKQIYNKKCPWRCTSETPPQPPTYDLTYFSEDDDFEAQVLMVQGALGPILSFIFSADNDDDVESVVSLD